MVVITTIRLHSAMQFSFCTSHWAQGGVSSVPSAIRTWRSREGDAAVDATLNPRPRRSRPRGPLDLSDWA